MSMQVLSVTQVNEYIRAMMDHDDLLTGVAVKGEISNYKLYPSGHHYFTLKDDGSSLRCVIFRGNATKLKFRPENGMKIIAIGKVTVFPRDGAYQLYCTAITLDGVGDLHTAFEQLKRDLAAKGLFDPGHKKPLPKFPKTIGIVTSSAGAAVHDILRILNKRYPLVNVRLLPVRVQGAEAPAEIVSAIRYANHYKLADLLIVGRGGGSIEDLWAFNDEQVAYAIYSSEIPIISAVGHEPDVTISDYVADVRAATPSNAAELAVPDLNMLYQELDIRQNLMISVLDRKLKAARKHLELLASCRALQSPEQYIIQKRNFLEHLQTRILSAQQNNLSRKRHRYISLTAKIDAMSPLKVLTRGYSMVQSADGAVVKSVRQISCGDELKISLQDGTVIATVSDIKEN